MGVKAILWDLGDVNVARAIGMTAFVYNSTEGIPIRVLLAGLRNAGVEI